MVSGTYNPFVSSEVETPVVRTLLHGLSASLEANGRWCDCLSKNHRKSEVVG